MSEQEAMKVWVVSMALSKARMMSEPFKVSLSKHGAECLVQQLRNLDTNMVYSIKEVDVLR